VRINYLSAAPGDKQEGLDNIDIFWLGSNYRECRADQRYTFCGRDIDFLIAAPIVWDLGFCFPGFWRSAAGKCVESRVA